MKRERLFLVFLVFILLFLPGVISAVVPQDSSVIVDQGLTNVLTRDIVRDSRGWLYAVYWTVFARGDVYCSRSTDNGRSWGRLARLNPHLADIPALALGRGDTLYVIWRKCYTDTLGTDVFLSKYNGIEWSTPLNISNQHALGGDFHNGTIAVDGNDHPHVAWDYDYSVYHSYHDGSGWTPPEYLGPGLYPTFSPDTGSALHLVYYDINLSGNIAYRRWSSGIWGPEEDVNDRQNWASGAGVVGDFRGVPHVIWSASDSFGAPSQAFYSKRQGGVWSPSISITPAVVHLMATAISCDQSNRLYVAYQHPYPDTSLSHPQVFYTTFDGANWSPETLITSDTSRYHGRANLGYPVTSYGVDLLWTTYSPPPAYKDSVVYLRLPLVGSGVEGEKPVEPRGEGLQFSVRSPVRSQLVVRYFLPQSDIRNPKCVISLYDLSGRLIAALDEGVKPSGWHEVKCPLKLPSGIYFLRLEAGSVNLTRKLVVLR